MNTLDDTIREKMLSWPSLFPNRAAVLNRIFIEGRGHWNHEPITLRSVDEARSRALEHAREMYVERVAQEHEMGGTPEQVKRSLDFAESFFEEKVARIEKVFVNFDATVAGKDTVVTDHFYPMTDDTQYPSVIHMVANCDDAPADWVDGAREAIALILACPFEETEHGALARNQRIAKRLLKKINATYGEKPLPDVSYVTWNEAHPFSETVKLRAKMKTILGGRATKRRTKKQSA